MGEVRHLLGDHDNGRFEFAPKVFHLGREIRVAPNPSGLFRIQDRKLSAFVELVVDQDADGFRECLQRTVIRRRSTCAGCLSPTARARARLPKGCMDFDSGAGT